MNLLSITELITPEETHDQNKFTRLHNIGSAMIYVSLPSLESVLTTVLYCKTHVFILMFMYYPCMYNLCYSYIVN